MFMMVLGCKLVGVVFICVVIFVCCCEIFWVSDDILLIGCVYLFSWVLL